MEFVSSDSAIDSLREILDVYPTYSQCLLILAMALERWIFICRPNSRFLSEPGTNAIYFIWGFPYWLCLFQRSFFFESIFYPETPETALSLRGYRTIVSERDIFSKRISVCIFDMHDSKSQQQGKDQMLMLVITTRGLWSVFPFFLCICLAC